MMPGRKGLRARAGEGLLEGQCRGQLGGGGVEEGYIVSLFHPLPPPPHAILPYHTLLIS